MCVHPNSPWQGANFRLRPAANCRHQKVRITNTSKKHSPNFIPFSDTGYLPCGFAYISRHSHHTLFEVFSLASIVHFGLLSPPCTFPGILYILHSKYRFLHFLRQPATFSLGYISCHIQPSFLAEFFRIRFIYCWRRLDDCRLT